MKMQMFLFIFNAKIPDKFLDYFFNVKLQAVFLIREVERTESTR